MSARRPAEPAVARKREARGGSTSLAPSRSALATGTVPASAASRADAAPVLEGNVHERRRLLAGIADSPLTSYYLLVGATAILVVLGLVMVLSSSSADSLADGQPVYAEFLSQARFALAGLVPMVAAVYVRPTVYQKFAWPILGLGLALQALTFTPMVRGKAGNMSWVYLGGGVSLQPSEFLKVALAIWLGTVLARKAALLDDWRHVVVPGGLVVALALAMVLRGHDLGSAIIVMMLASAAFWVSGVPVRFFLISAAALVAVAGALIVDNENRIMRISTWLSASCGSGSPADADLCYQTMHGLWGLGTGGLTGVGLGAGRQKWSYLPEAHNDFIFSVIGEELGLVGAVAVLLLFGVLGYAMMRIVRRHPDRMVKISAAAFAAWILGQMFVNIAVVVGLAPVVGVPLPLVSAGGSALVATMIALGVVMSFARDEPGAREALTARRRAVRRSVAVLGRRRAKAGSR